MPFPDEFTTFVFIDDCPNNIDVEQEIEDINLKLDSLGNVTTGSGPDYWSVYI